MWIEEEEDIFEQWKEHFGDVPGVMYLFISLLIQHSIRCWYRPKQASRTDINLTSRALRSRGRQYTNIASQSIWRNQEIKDGGRGEKRVTSERRWIQAETWGMSTSWGAGCGRTAGRWRRHKKILKRPRAEFSHLHLWLGVGPIFSCMRPDGKLLLSWGPKEMGSQAPKAHCPSCPGDPRWEN